MQGSGVIEEGERKKIDGIWWKNIDKQRKQAL